MMMRRSGFKWLVVPTVMVLVMLGLSALPASATTPGWIDLSYGVSGVANLPSPNQFGTTVVDGTGRAVTVSSSNTNGNGDIVTRLTVNGALDSSFGSDGSFVLPAATFYEQPVIGPSGNIYIAGSDAVPGKSSTQIIVTELTSSGALDTNFGTGGTATIAVTALSAPVFTTSDIAVRNDGDVLVALGTASTVHTGYLLALTPTGGLDPAFGPVSTPGWLAYPAGLFPYALTAAVTGNSVGLVVANVVNPAFAFQTYSSTGALGLSKPFAASVDPDALSSDADGTWLVTGAVGSSVFLGNISTTGVINLITGPSEDCDPAGGQIAVSSSAIYVIAFDTSSASDCFSPAIVLRFAAGALDSSFGSDGEVVVDLLSTFGVFGPDGGGIQPDGNLLVGIDGSSDAPSFNTDNAAVVRINTQVAAPAVQAFVQGASDTVFSAEQVASNPAGSFIGTPSPVVDVSGTTDVFLQGANDDLFISQRLVSGWSAPLDITATVSGGPGLGSSPQAVLDGKVLHVFALASGSGDVVDYHNDGPGGSWLSTDVTATDPGAPAMSPSFSALDLGGTLHVYGTSAAGDLVEIDNDNIDSHEWNFYDLKSDAGGGVPTSGAPGPVLINGVPHVYVRGTGTDDLIEFVADHLGGRIWNAYDQTLGTAGAPMLSGNPIPALIGTTPHVYVDDADNGDLVEFVADHLFGNIWNSYDQTVDSDAPQLTGNPSVALVDGAPYGLSGPIPEVFENAFGALAIVVADHELGDIWNSYDVSEQSGGSAVTGDPSVVVNNSLVEVLSLTSNQQLAADSRLQTQRSSTGLLSHALASKAARLGPFGDAHRALAH